MEELKRLIEILIAALNRFLDAAAPPITPAPPKKTPSEILLDLAEAFTNIDPTPKDEVDDALACAHSLTTILRKMYTDFPASTYTPVTLADLKKSKHFKGTLDIKPGYVIISPTGAGNGTIRGHCGIIGRNNTIWSNHSNTGLWQDYFTIDKWVARYRHKGGLPVLVFQPL